MKFINNPNTYRYELEKGSRKFICPRCDRKTFVRFVDTTTQNYCDSQYGRCDREIKCQYFNTPEKPSLLYHKSQINQPVNKSKSTISSTDFCSRPKVTIVPEEIFRQSRSDYGRNNLARYFATVIGPEETKRLIELYHLGTSSKWKGACIFWQIDSNGKIRAGKVMQYVSATGKRYLNYITWIHRINKIDGYELDQCFFGEHLLGLFPDKPVAIVESEKTAMICSLYFPEFNWIATGGLVNLNAEKCKVLIGKRVHLFPDLGARDNWISKAEKIRMYHPEIQIQVSNFLEQNSTDHERELGLDLADYILHFEAKEFCIRNYNEDPLNKKSVKQ